MSDTCALGTAGCAARHPLDLIDGGALCEIVITGEPLRITAGRMLGDSRGVVAVFAAGSDAPPVVMRSTTARQLGQMLALAASVADDPDVWR
jgi:hypothetical protein